MIRLILYRLDVQPAGDSSITTFKTGCNVPHIMCSGRQHAIKADQPALIIAGRGDVPVTELRLRCGACGG